MGIRPVVLLVLAVQTVPVFCADFSYTGALTQDDDERQFNFTLRQPATVTIRTYSYAGGLNAAGTQLPRGGFDPTISVFDSSGELFTFNRDGGCAKVSRDKVTAFCFDAYIQQEFPAGTWQVVLTESENLPNGPTLADSFVYDGYGNFTADPDNVDSQGFWDFFPNQRTANYSLDILGVDSSQPPLLSTVGGIVNSASYASGSTAPNTILSLIDSHLMAGPNDLVAVGGEDAVVLYARGNQINFVVPPDVKPSNNLPIEVWSGSTLLVSTSIAVTDASPGLFTLTASGTGQAAVLNAGPAGNTLNGASAPLVPASRGNYIAIYGTGFGAANPPSADGLSWLSDAVTAAIGGKNAEVVFAGLAPGSTLGLQQINVLIPEDAPTGPSVPIRLQIGTHATQSGTTVAIQ
jgi:uncharacterized protein (TIGR03437 family)